MSRIKLVLLVACFTTYSHLNAQNWQITGNSAGAIDYLGTNNMETLKIRTNSTPAVVVDVGGDVEIGPAAENPLMPPTTSKLQVGGPDLDTYFSLSRRFYDNGADCGFSSDWHVVNHSPKNSNCGLDALGTRLHFKFESYQPVLSLARDYVGILETDPTNRLTIQSFENPGAGGGIRLDYFGKVFKSRIGLTTSGPDGLVFQMSANSGSTFTNELFISKDGLVGVGTMNPQGHVDLETGSSPTDALFVKASPTVDNQGGIIHHQGDGNTFAWQEVAQNSGDFEGTDMLRFNYVDRLNPSSIQTGDVLVMTSLGYVGIGTDDPMGRLDVRSGSAVGDALYVKSHNTAPLQGGIIHHQGSTYAWNEVPQSTGSTDGALIFNYVEKNNPSQIEQPNVLVLRANANSAFEGRIGMGTDNPQSHLHIVDGALNLTGTSSNNEGERFLIDAESNKVSGMLKVKTDNGDILYVRGVDGQSNGLQGKVAINVANAQSNLPGEHSLYVAGSIITEEVYVKLQADWPDFVFKKEYGLRSIEEMQQFIAENGHLPEIPSAQEVEETGIATGEIIRAQMQKIEELSLYVIELNERIKELETAAE